MTVLFFVSNDPEHLSIDVDIHTCVNNHNMYTAKFTLPVEPYTHVTVANIPKDKLIDNIVYFPKSGVVGLFSETGKNIRSLIIKYPQSKKTYEVTLTAKMLVTADEFEDRVIPRTIRDIAVDRLIENNFQGLYISECNEIKDGNI